MARTEKELPSGIILVEGTSEEKEPPEIQFKVYETLGRESKETLIARGIFTEESYKEAVRETTEKMILAGARRKDNGYWSLETEDSVWEYCPWDWRQPIGGYNKKCLSLLRRTEPFPVEES